MHSSPGMAWVIIMGEGTTDVLTISSWSKSWLGGDQSRGTRCFSCYGAEIISPLSFKQIVADEYPTAGRPAADEI